MGTSASSIQTRLGWWPVIECGKSGSVAWWLKNCSGDWKCKTRNTGCTIQRFFWDFDERPREKRLHPELRETTGTTKECAGPVEPSNFHPTSHAASFVIKKSTSSGRFSFWFVRFVWSRHFYVPARLLWKEEEKDERGMPKKTSVKCVLVKCTSVG